MGRITQPKYRIELSCINFVNKRKEIHSYPYTGKANDIGAKKYRDEINKSFEIGGVNEHLNGKQSQYSNAVIIEQKTGQPIACYIAPMFEIV